MKAIGTIITTISLICILPFSIFAFSDLSLIGASVKVSVCGDDLVEGQEDCEMGLNHMFNCQDFGYLPDIIYCDNSCAYDLLSCKPIKPIVPPIDNNNNNKEPEVIEEPSLPKLMINWDKNSDGLFTLEEFASFITNWINNWKSFIIIPKENTEKETVARECDINSDKVCNVTDFSIILYYLNTND